MDRINKNNFNNEQLVEIISLLGEAEKKQNKIIVKIAQENPNLLQELEKKISGAFSTSWKKAEKNSKDEDEKEEELLFSQI